MKANLQPLDGKYYGSVIEITTDNGTKYYVELWNSKGPPSQREIDKELGEGKLTVREWIDNSIVVVDGLQGLARTFYEVCDTHYESEETYNLAKQIVDMINGQS